MSEKRSLDLPVLGASRRGQSYGIHAFDRTLRIRVKSSQIFNLVPEKVDPHWKLSVYGVHVNQPSADGELSGSFAKNFRGIIESIGQFFDETLEGKFFSLPHDQLVFFVRFHRLAWGEDRFGSCGEKQDGTLRGGSLFI